MTPRDRGFGANGLRPAIRRWTTTGGPRVSVVIPAFNAAATLEDTLHALRAQTFAKWEAIVVDDGSTDATAAISRKLGRADRRIRATSQGRCGEASARNRGIALARYDWLLFLDADDTVAATHLERLTHALAADAVLDAVYCDWSRVLPDGTADRPIRSPAPEELFEAATTRCPFAIHACVVRRSLVMSVGCFDTTLVTCPDWDLWQRLARTRARFGNVSEALARTHGRSGSAGGQLLQVLGDGWTVIERGHRTDPRVRRPDPAYSDGRPADRLGAAKAAFLCWVAGLTIGQGQSPDSLVTRLGSHAGRPDAGLAANMLFEATLLPAGHTSGAWPDLWPRVRNDVIGFLRGLERHAALPGFATDVEARMVARIESLDAGSQNGPAAQAPREVPSPRSHEPGTAQH
jgi:hypothetical protein